MKAIFYAFACAFVLIRAFTYDTIISYICYDSFNNNDSSYVVKWDHCKKLYQYHSESLKFPTILLKYIALLLIMI